MADETREPEKESTPSPTPEASRRHHFIWKPLGALYHGRREQDWKTRAVIRYGSLTVVTLTVLAILRVAVHEAMTSVPRDVHNALESQAKVQKAQADAVVRALEKSADAQLKQAQAISDHMALEDRYFAVLLDRANVIVKHTAKPSSTTIVIPAPQYQQMQREAAPPRERAQPQRQRHEQREETPYEKRMRER